MVGLTETLRTRFSRSMVSSRPRYSSTAGRLARVPDLFAETSTVDGALPPSAHESRYRVIHRLAAT